MQKLKIDQYIIIHLSFFSPFLLMQKGKNGASCNPSNGKCSCSKGWKGTHCEERICADHMYGNNCESTCECDKNTTRSCHPFTGKCDCNAGWSSNLCNRPCPFLTWGENCAKECNCNGAQCNPITGKCVCAPGYQGMHSKGNWVFFFKESLIFWIFSNGNFSFLSCSWC